MFQKFREVKSLLLMRILKPESEMMEIKGIYIQKEWAKKHERILTRKAALRDKGWR